MIKPTTNNTRRRVAVIGGGAAGVMAAGFAALRGCDTVIIEKNDKLCKKLMITGKGRCNLTNECSIPEFLENVPRNPQFLRSSLSAFAPGDAMAFFRELGVELTVERGNRVFPASNRAGDVAGALKKFINRAGVKVIKGAATDILTENSAVCAVKTTAGLIPADGVILAAGGMSYPGTGSTGDGYALAGKLGHTVITPRPSLAPMVSPDAFCAEMQGLSLRNVALTAYTASGKKLYEDFGEMLFTHFGVSGPMILSASAHIGDIGEKGCILELDLKPALDRAKLDKRILRDFAQYSNREFANSLGLLLHKTMIPVVAARSGIPPGLRVHSITKEQRLGLVDLIKRFTVRVTGYRPIEEAIVTSGGVSVEEISQRTMESKLVHGLFFAGEVMDLDAFTGGFNLQIAWTTAYAAGNSI